MAYMRVFLHSTDASATTLRSQPFSGNVSDACHVMKTCISFDELLAIHRPQIQEMQRVGDSFPDPHAAAAGEALARHVRLVEGVLRQTYREAVALARRAAEAADLAEILAGMSGFCSAVLQMLVGLKHRYHRYGF